VTASPAPSPTDAETSRRSNRGESLVWLTGMGLATGLLMITALLLLILVKGAEAFWPLRIARVELVASAAERLGQPVLYAHILGSREKRIGATDAAGRRAEEIKLQVANRDAGGTGFVYLDLADVAKITEPPDLVRLDRVEYGPAIGQLVSLQPLDEPLVTAPEEMASLLRRLVAEGNARRATIERIERREIGGINRTMERLRRQIRAAERLEPPDQAHLAHMATLKSRIESLEVDYQRLASTAAELRDRQGKDTLIYRLASGIQRSIPVGNLVGVSFPNQLSFTQRVGTALHNAWAFISESPREANTEGGIFPALFGTFVMTVILSLAVTPFGVIAAIYLKEYAKEGALVRAVRIAINNLAGVPSIVFGVFGLGFFVYVLGGSIDALFYSDRDAPVFGTGGILWASLTLALMTVPVVIVATEEALAAVTRGVREGSLACGASKWQTIQRIVLPAAAPGIITGMILAMARGAGEGAPLMITGVVKLAPTLPLDGTPPFLHLDRKFMHLGFHIYDVGFQSPDSDAARPMVFATTLLLILLVVTMNLGAIFLRERLRRKYATGVF